MSEAAAVVQQFFDALRRKDRELALELVAPEAVFIAMREEGSAQVPLYGTFEGKEGASRFLANLAESFDTQKFEIRRIMGDSEWAAAWGSFSHIVRRTGSLFNSEWALVCQTRDGRILRYQFYEDTAALERAFGVL